MAVHGVVPGFQPLIGEKNKRNKQLIFDALVVIPFFNIYPRFMCKK